MIRTTLFTALLFMVSTAFSNAADAQNIAQDKRVIVLDAGHGGSAFPGATYRGVYEKDINLSVVLKLGKLIETNIPDVKVIYTRKTDKHFNDDLTKDLQERANIANNSGGELFISVHCNAARSRTARGVETWIMGESSRETEANESAVYANNKEDLLDMSDQKTAAIVRAYIQNLQFTYGQYSEAIARCVQRNYAKCGYVDRGIKRKPLKVLYSTDMPSMLTEIGFMSNAEDFAHITSDKGQNEIVGAIYNALKEYLNFLSGSRLPDYEAPAVPVEDTQAIESDSVGADNVVAPQSTPMAEKTVAEQPKTSVAEPIGYTIQLQASSDPLSLKSAHFQKSRYKVKQYVGEGAFRYKYCAGQFDDKAQAQAKLIEIKKSFPKAFVVKYKGDKIVN